MNQNDVISAAVGLLAREQVAAQLPFGDRVHAALLTKRLLARLSLRSQPFDGDVRVTLDDLKAFLSEGATNHKVRAALGLPDETLSPIFGIDDEWFAEGPLAFEAKWWTDALTGEARKQFPRFVKGAEQVYTGGSILRLNNVGMEDEFGETMVVLKRWGTSTPLVPGTIEAKPTKEMQRIIDLPATGTPFKNMGEYYLATLLQRQAQIYIQQAVMATFIGMANPPLKQPLSGLDLLYNSAADYARVISAATNVMSGSSAFSDQRIIDGFIVLLKMQHQTLMQMAGTDSARLISLAF